MGIVVEDDENPFKNITMQQLLECNAVDKKEIIEKTKLGALKE